jgi:hypothetical protein
MYARIYEKGIIVKEYPFDGSKPLVRTEPETREGYIAYSAFTETADAIVEVWSYVIDPDPTPSPPEEATTEDYESALSRLGVEV